MSQRKGTGGSAQPAGVGVNYVILPPGYVVTAMSIARFCTHIVPAKSTTGISAARCCPEAATQGAPAAYSRCTILFHEINMRRLLPLLLVLLLPLAACGDGSPTDPTGLGPWRRFVRLDLLAVPDFNPGDSIRVGAAAGEERGRTPFNTEVRVLYSSLEQPDSFRWMSSDSTVISIDRLGMMRARREGTARITAESGGVVSEPLIQTVVPSR